MGFKNDFSQADFGNTLKPIGDYECIIVSIEEMTNKNGKTRLSVQMVIRNDVQGQRYGNACLFYDVWKRREPTSADMQVGGYGFSQIMSLGKAAGLPNGKDYANLREYCEDLLHKCVRAHLDHEDYNGNTYERVRWLETTKVPECKHVFKKSPPQNDDFANKDVQGIGSLAEFETVHDDGNVPF